MQKQNITTGKRLNQIAIQDKDFFTTTTESIQTNGLAWFLGLATILALFQSWFLLLASPLLATILSSMVRGRPYPETDIRTARDDSVTQETKNWRHAPLFSLGNAVDYERPLWLSEEIFKRHLVVIGTTGSGKTEFLLYLTAQAVIIGSSVIFADGKADVKTVGRLQAICHAARCEENFRVLNFGVNAGVGKNIYENTHNINVLYRGDKNENTEIVNGFLPGDGNDPLWPARARSMNTGLMAAQVELRDLGESLVPGLAADEEIFTIGAASLADGMALGRYALYEKHPLLSKEAKTQIRRYLDVLPGFRTSGPAQPQAGAAGMGGVPPGGMAGGVPAGVAPFNGGLVLGGAPNGVMTAGGFQNQAMLGGVNNGFPGATSPMHQGLGIAANGQQHAPDMTAGVAPPPPAWDAPIKINPEADKQHAFCTMQFSSVLGLFNVTYRHLLTNTVGEIDVLDVILRRRVLYVMLPSMQKTAESMKQLGQLLCGQIRIALSKTFGASIEGETFEIIYSRPTEAPCPLLLILDEYGSFGVEGFGEICAQARSVSVSTLIAVQDWASLKKVDDKQIEAGRTWANSNTRIFLKSIDSQDTMKIIDDAIRKVMVEVSGGREYRMGVAMDGGIAAANQNTTRYEERSPVDLTKLYSFRDGAGFVQYADQVHQFQSGYIDPDRSGWETPEKLDLLRLVPVQRPRKSVLREKLEGLAKFSRDLVEGGNKVEITTSESTDPLVPIIEQSFLETVSAVKAFSEARRDDGNPLTMQEEGWALFFQLACNGRQAISKAQKKSSYATGSSGDAYGEQFTGRGDISTTGLSDGLSPRMTRTIPEESLPYQADSPSSRFDGHHDELDDDQPITDTLGNLLWTATPNVTTAELETLAEDPASPEQMYAEALSAVEPMITIPACAKVPYLELGTQRGAAKPEAIALEYAIAAEENFDED